MLSIKMETRRKVVVAGCLALLVGAFSFWSPDSTASSTRTLVGTELVQTAEASQYDSCWSGVCVEQCFLWSDGVMEPTGKFCCVSSSQVGQSGTCPVSSRVGGPF